MTSAYYTNDSKTNMLSGIILTQTSLERISNMKEQRSPLKQSSDQNEMIDNLKQNQYLIKSNFQNNTSFKKKSRRQDGESLNMSHAKVQNKKAKLNSDYVS